MKLELTHVETFLIHSTICHEETEKDFTLNI